MCSWLAHIAYVELPLCVLNNIRDTLDRCEPFRVGLTIKTYHEDGRMAEFSLDQPHREGS